MNAIGYTLVSIVIISLISFTGALMLSFRKQILDKLSLFLVSFGVGALMGDAFIHLLPEAIDEGIGATRFGTFALLGIFIFFTIEKFLRWQHRHVFSNIEEGQHYHPYVKPYVWMNLVGDGLHNFIDGMVIAGTYLVSIPLGITTTIAVATHECAQEIGDFAILIKGGLSKTKALLYNFLSALTAILGGVITLALGSQVSQLSLFLIPFAFASFTYIAMATLIPELHHEDTPHKLAAQACGILLGIGAMALLIFLE